MAWRVGEATLGSVWGRMRAGDAVSSTMPTA